MKKRAGFTLLEVMLAVGVLALVAVSIYRFVESTLQAVRISSEQLRENALTSAFAGFLRNQLQSLPSGKSGVLSGDPHRFDNISSDELRWISGPGSGVLTRFAKGEWNVTLTTKQLKEGGFELGLRRQDIGAREPSTWLPLFPGVNGFEVRYYDPRSQQWMEKWTDGTLLPALVRMRLWRNGAAEAYEVVFPLPVASSNNAQFNNPGNPSQAAPAPAPAVGGKAGV